MTRSTFTPTPNDRLQVACRLATKAIAQKLRVLIYAPEGDTAQRSIG